MIFVVERASCTGCEECVAICPVGAIAILEGRAQIATARCISCGACLSECGEEAIQQLGTRTKD